MNKAYSELTYWTDDITEDYYTLRYIGWNDKDPSKAKQVEIGCSKTEQSVVLPIALLREMVMDIPHLEEQPKPLPFADVEGDF